MPTPAHIRISRLLSDLAGVGMPPIKGERVSAPGSFPEANPTSLRPTALGCPQPLQSSKSLS